MANTFLAQSKDFLTAAVELVFPAVCHSCGTRLSYPEKQVCTGCEAELLPPSADSFGKGSVHQGDNSLPYQEEDFSFSFARAAVAYEQVAKTLVHRLKYDAYQALADYFALKMAEALESYPEFEDYELVTAVPLHRVRKRERGFNQSELIARSFAKYSGKSYAELISRKRYTRSQTELDFHQRRKNVSGAFSAKSAAQGRNIIVIDDVFTTGHTINESTLALLEAGAKSVAAYTFSRAIG
ncbi:MAG: ComF family protein [Candidatus Cloacimonadaceae bacterium]